VGHAAQPAVLIEARADGAEGDLLLGDLMAVVAVATVGRTRLVAPGHAAAALGDLLAFLPVAEVLAASRRLHRLRIGGLEGLGLRLGQRLTKRLRAGGVGRVLLEPVELRNALRMEGRLDDLLRLLV